MTDSMKGFLLVVGFLMILTGLLSYVGYSIGQQKGCEDTCRKDYSGQAVYRDDRCFCIHPEATCKWEVKDITRE